MTSVEQAYAEGFMAKCAELGVNPEELEKERKAPGIFRSSMRGAGTGAVAGAILSALAELGGSRRWPKDPFNGAALGSAAGGFMGSVIGATR